MNEEITCPRCTATASSSASKCPACAYEFGPNTKQEVASHQKSGDSQAPPPSESSLKPPIVSAIKTKPDFSKDAQLSTEYPPPVERPRRRVGEVILAGCLAFLLLIVAAFTMCVISMGA